MDTKGKIKVIKRGTPKLAQTKVAAEKKSAPVAAREIVSNVSNWVNEFQQRRRDETKNAIEKFFPRPQANNV